LKLIVPVLLLACAVVGALSWFAFVSLHASIASIYEQRARSVASLISKSIQEKDYVLYYSEDLTADINQLLSRDESIVEITVIGLTARGFLAVASTDPTNVGRPASEVIGTHDEPMESAEATVERTRETGTWRAHQPILSGSDLVGAVVVDMSTAEMAAYDRRLSWQFALGSVVGFILLGGSLLLVLRAIVTRPIRRLALATAAVTMRDYDVEVELPPRIPGTPLRDEVAQLVDRFNLMTKVIHSHEQELKKLVVLDDVTGLYNADHFREQLEIELSKGRRYKHPTSVLALDVEGLAGRSVEDQTSALVRASTFFVSGLRRVDTVFRIDSHRLAAILPETPADGAAVAADRLQRFASDVTSLFSFPVSLRVRSTGWGAAEEVSLDEALRWFSGPAEDRAV
ncbi:MAG: diguanylate cyclase, partial [Candidatus Bipolaricaulis sp.]|nr:diguanylate cyclase [Candidatus Bipolaricaulis sp.]